MKDLNEKLAEVCGATPVDEMATRDIRVVGWEFPDGSFVSERSWNPTQDLNQLRECYLAAGFEEHEGTDKFMGELSILIKATMGVEHQHRLVSSLQYAVAWVKHPELVAQAILKAKGVV